MVGSNWAEGVGFANDSQRGKGNVQLAQADTRPATQNSPNPDKLVVTKPENGQAITLDASRVSEIDLRGVTTEQIGLQRNGSTLKIVFAQGQSVTIFDFFDDSGNGKKIDVGPDTVLTPQKFAQTFPISYDQTVQTAAGDTGGPGGGALQGGHQFNDPTFDTPPGGQTPTALLQRTDFDRSTNTLTPQANSFPTEILPITLPSVIEQVIGSSGATIQGTVPVNFGANGFGSVTLSGALSIDGNAFVVPVGGSTQTALTSGGVPVTFSLSADGLTLTGSAHGDTLIIVRVDGARDAGYSVQVLGPIDHSFNGTSENFVVGIIAKDNTQSGNPQTFNDAIQFNILDTSPTGTAIATTDLTEGHTALQADGSGNAFAPASLTNVSLNINWGADNETTTPVVRTLAFDTTTAPAGLTSDGVAITYSIGTAANGDPLLTATAGGRTVFTIELDPKAANGAYTFTLLDNIDHPSPTSGSQDTSPVTLNFAFRATDADGDQAAGNFSVRIADDVPTIGTVATQTVNEDALSGGNLGDSYVAIAAGNETTTASGTLNITWGADSANANVNGGFTGTQVDGDRSVIFTQATLNGLNTLNLTSDGQPLSYALSANGTVLTATAGTGESTHTIFTVSLSDTGAGSYSYTLIGHLDHPIANQEDNLNLPFAFTARDGDGDAVSSSFTVTVNDDAPTTSSIATQTVNEDALKGGNPGDSYGNVEKAFRDDSDVKGEDVLKSDVAVAESTTATSALNISWGADNANSRVDGGFTGTQINGDRSVVFNASTGDTATFGNGQTLTSDGFTVKLWVSADGTEVIGYRVHNDIKLLAEGPESEQPVSNRPALADQVFDITLSDQGTGSYTFTLLGPIDHPIANQEDNVTLNFGFTARDSDGDSVVSSFNVTINDDAPVTTGSIETQIVGEDGLSTANVTGGSYDAVDNSGVSNIALNIAWGADKDTKNTDIGDIFGRTLSFLTNGEAPAAISGGTGTVGNLGLSITGEDGTALSSGGVALEYVVTALANGGETLTAYKGSNHSDANKVFVLTLDPTSASGSYSFDLLGTLDHGIESNVINLTFAVQAADADGDTVNTRFTVQVQDDTPVIEVADPGANLITNGNFTDGFGTPTGFGAVGQATGWTYQVSGGVSEQQLERVTLPYTVNGSTVSGNGATQALDLDLSPGDVALSQTVSGVKSGEVYTLSFQAGGLAGFSESMDVYWGGNKVLTLSQAELTGDLRNYTVNVIGGAGDGSNKLTFQETGAPDNSGTFLANVSLTLAGSSTTVDEDGGLIGGNPGGNGDTTAKTSVIGALGIHWGSDNADFADSAGFQDGATLDSNASPAALTGRAAYFADNSVGVTTDQAPLLQPLLVPEGVKSESPALTSNGQTVLFRIVNDGTTLEGYVPGSGEGEKAVGERLVFTVSLSDDGSGHYSFTLLGPIDHPVSGTEDNIALTFNYTARDFDGDIAQSTFTVTVNDDTPIQTGSIATHTVNEDALKSGNPGDSYTGPTSGETLLASDSLNISWGADNANKNLNGGFAGQQVAGDRSVVFATDAISTLNAWNLSSDGIKLQYVLSDNDTILTAYRGGGRDTAAKVFTVSLSDADNGSYSFTLNGNLDHPIANQEDNLDLTFKFTARDSDGDAVSSSFTVTVNDDAPVIGKAAAGVVDEDHLATGNLGDQGIPQGGDAHGATTGATGSLAISWGADNNDSGLTNNRSVSFTSANAATDVHVTGAYRGDGTTLTSDGQTVKYVIIGDTLYGYTGEVGRFGPTGQVFTVSLNDDGNGSYNFKLLGNLDHAKGGGENNITLAFDYTAKDSDGDKVSSQFTVTVNDDAPIANKGDGVTLAEDDISKYQATDNTPANFPQLDITSKTGDLNIKWGADNNDSGLTNNRSVSFTSADAASDVHVTGAYGGNGTTLTSDGQTVKYAIVDGVLYGFTGESYKFGQVFTVSLNDDGSGSYDFKLLGNLDHAKGGGENSLTLTFDYTATDSDGDAASNTFTVTVKDDVPVIGKTEHEYVNEDDLPKGTDTHKESTTQVGELNVSWGADDNNSGATNNRSLALVDDSAPNGLTSDGVALTYKYNADHTVLTAFKGYSADKVFTVSLSDLGTGSYTFELIGNLDHPVGQGQNNIDLKFNFTATDSDGDTTAPASFTVTVTDDIPTLTGAVASQNVGEDGLSGANLTGPAGGYDAVNNASVSSALNVNWGADDDTRASGDTFGRTLAFDMLNGQPMDSSGHALALTSDGVPLTYSVVPLSNGGQELIAYRGTPDMQIFKIDLDPTAPQGAYTFTLLGNLDHIANGQPTNDLPLDFRLTATDADGDSIRTDFTVHVQDDTPTTTTAQSGLVNEDPFLDGSGVFNVGGSGDAGLFVGLDTGNRSLGINWGADDNLKSEALTSNQIGTVDDPIGRMVSFAASDGSALGGTAGFTSGTLVAPKITATDGVFTFNATTLTSDGATLLYKLSYLTDNAGHWDGGYVLLAYKNGGSASNADDQVFQVTIDPTATHGAYDFKLLGNLDHPVAGTEDNLNLTFAVVAADADGDSVATNFTVAVNDDTPVVVLPISSIVNEDSLPGGNPGGIGDIPFTGTTTNNTLGIAWGADNGNSAVNGGFSGQQVNGDRSVVFASDIISNLTNLHLKSAGQELSYTLSGNGSALIATAGSDNHTVFTVTLSDQDAGSYRFVLSAPLDHPAGKFENNITLDFGFTARDGDGDPAKSSFSVTINDDTPVITTASIQAGLVDEDALTGGNAGDSYPANSVPLELKGLAGLNVLDGNHLGTAGDIDAGNTASGALGVSWGADNGSNRTLTFDATNLPTGLKSGGADVNVHLSSDGATLIAYTGDNFADTAHQVFTVTLDKTAANGSYTFMLQAPLDEPVADKEDSINLSFGFIAKDADGDTAKSSFTVTVNDDAPTADFVGLAPIQEAAVGGVFTTVTETGILPFKAGADGATVTDLVYRFSGAPNVAIDGDASSFTGVPMTSNGLPVTITKSVLDGVITLTGATTAGTIFTFAVTADGHYTYTQSGPLDHPDQGVNGSETGSNDPLALTFDYVVTDKDGDHATNAINLTIKDDGPTITTASIQAGLVDEDALTGGNAGDSYPANSVPLELKGLAGLNVLDGNHLGTAGDIEAGNTASGALGVNWGADNGSNRTLTFDATNLPNGLKSGGEAVNFHLSNDGATLIAYTGENFADTTHQVFTVTLDKTAANGSYTFTLQAPLDEPVADKEDSINLSFGFIAKDADGDTAKSSFTVTVNDDAPTADFVGLAPIQEAAVGGVFTTVTETGVLPFKAGADGATVTDLVYRFSGAPNVAIDGDASSFTGVPMTSNGLPVTITKSVLDGVITLTGATTAGTIFTFAVTADGHYTYTQSGPLDHPDQGVNGSETGSNDPLALTFDYVVTDKDGDHATNAINLTIKDDGPTLAPVDHVAASVDESKLSTDANPQGQTQVDVKPLNILFGADDGSQKHLEFAGTGPALKSGGVDIVYQVTKDQAGNDILTAYKGDTSGNIVFSLNLSTSTYQGAPGAGYYAFALFHEIDHPAGEGTKPLALTFNVRAVDADGDSVTETITVNVTDSVPTATGTVITGSINESALDTSVAHGTGEDGKSDGPAATLTGSLASLVHFGADVPGSYQVETTNLSSSLTLLTSHGQPLSYSVNTVNNTLVASAGGQEVFDLHVDKSTGTYALTLKGALDNPAAVLGLTANAVPLSQIGTPGQSFTADWASGSSKTFMGRLPTGDVVIRVANGNASEQHWTLHEDNGTDFSLTIPANSAIFFNVGLVNGTHSFSVNGVGAPGGTATVGADDAKPLPMTTGDLTLDFSSAITVADFDGDTLALSGALKISVQDDAPVAGTAASAKVDEDGLIPGSHITTDTELLNINWGADGVGKLALTTNVDVSGLAANTHLQSSGQDVHFGLVSDALVGYTGNAAPTALTDSSIVFSLALNPATGNYTFTLDKPLDHSGAVGTPITLGFHANGSDFDGSPVATSLSVEIDPAGYTGSIHYDALQTGVFVNLDTISHTINDQTVSAGTATDITGQGPIVGIDNVTGVTEAHGGAGNDIIVGSAGSNILDGGAGNDTIVLTPDLVVPQGFSSALRTFDHGDGTSAQVDITGLGGEGDNIIGGAGADTLTFDITGTNATGFVFDRASYPDTGTFTGVEHIVGTAGNDVIMLPAGYTADAGPITIDGGKGNDVISGTNANDVINGGDDNDQLSGLAGNDVIHGNDGNDQIWGGKGDDQLYGDAGDDTFFYKVGDGADQIDGGANTAAGDTLNVTNNPVLNDPMNYYVSAAAGGFNLAIVDNYNGSPNPGETTVTTTGIENLNISLGNYEWAIIGTSGAGDLAGLQKVTVTGDDTGNVLSLGYLSSATAVSADLKGGDDTFIGGGQSVAAIVDGGVGTDKADYSQISESFVANLGAGSVERHSLSDNSLIATDTITNFENFTGSVGNDDITGSSAANVLQGGAGNDTFHYALGDGADTIDGGADSDTLKVTTPDSAQFLNEYVKAVGGNALLTPTQPNNAEAPAPYNATLSFTNVEHLDIELKNHNVLVFGQGGSDLASAGIQDVNVTGDDTGTALWFANVSSATHLTANLAGGDDTYVAGGQSIAQQVDGGTGTDTIDFSQITERFIANLATGSVERDQLNGTLVTTDSLTNFENFTGSVGDDIITGTNGANTLLGNDGNDRLSGGGGDDTLTGGAGKDTAAYDDARSNYTLDVTTDSSGFVTAFNGVTETGANKGAVDEGHDTLSSIERLDFANGTTVLDLDKNVQLFANGALIGTFDTIQAAVAAASDGNVVIARAGDYSGDVTIDKAITLIGANKGLDGAAARGSETDLHGQIFITAAAGDHVVIDGMKIENDSANGTSFNGVRVDSGADVTVQNSVFWSASANGITGNGEDKAIYLPTAATGIIDIAHNYIGGPAATGAVDNLYGDAAWARGIWSDGRETTLTIETNTFQNVRSALNLDDYNDLVSNISGNHVLSAGTAISIGGADPSSISHITGNDFGTGAPAETPINQVVDLEVNLQNLSTGLTIDVSGIGAVNDGLTVVNGTRGGDIITGTSGQDVIFGDGGASAAAGSNGDDSIRGGAGNDLIIGGRVTGTVDDTQADTALYSGTLDIGHITALSGAAYTAALTADIGAAGPLGTSGGITSGWRIDNSAHGDGVDIVSGVSILKDGSGHNILLVGDGGFTTIQAAVNAAHDGDTILLAPGTYDLSANQLTIDKSVTILGANHGVDGNGSRGAESVLLGPTTGAGRAISIADGKTVVIDGVAYQGDHVVDQFAPVSLTWTNSTFDLTTIADNAFYMGGNGGYTFTFTDNAVKATGYTTGLFMLFEGGAVNVTGNTFTGVAGTLVSGEDNSVPVILNLNKATGTVSGNTFDHVDIGVLLAGASHDLSVTNNTFEDLHRPAGNGLATGILFFDPHYTDSIDISGNAFTDADSGIRTSSYNNGSLNGLPVIFTIDNNTFTTTLENVHMSADGVLHLTNSQVNGQALPSLFVGGPDANVITGTAGPDVVMAGDGNDTITGGKGDDVLIGGAGNDLFLYKVGDGNDRVDGGSETGTTNPNYDVLQVTGDATARTFTIADATGGTNIVPTTGGDATDITVSYSGPDAASIRADEIERVVVNAGSGGDTLVVGDITGSAIAPSTIVFNGGAGNDTLDLTTYKGATSFVFNDNDGVSSGDTDLIKLAGHWTDYTVTGDAGNFTITGDGVSLTTTNAESFYFAADGQTIGYKQLMEQAPVTQPDVGNVNEAGYTNGQYHDYNSGTSNNVLGNDKDPNNSPYPAAPIDHLSVVGIAFGTTPATSANVPSSGKINIEGKYGNLDISANGDYFYHLENDNPATQALQNGTTVKDIFTYTVTDSKGGTATEQITVNVIGADDAPVALADSYTVKEDTPLTVAAKGVLANDTDVDSTSLSASLVSGPQHALLGSFQLNSDGSFTYQAAADYAGGDSFTYKVNDGQVDGNTVTVSLTVSAVDDGAAALTLSDATQHTTAPKVGDILSTALGADPDGAESNIVYSWYRDGTTQISGQSGSTYTLTSTDIGHTVTAHADYTDGQGFHDTSISGATAAVIAANSPPVANSDNFIANKANNSFTIPTAALLWNDTDADHNSLSVTDVAYANGLTFISAANNGNMSFNYHVSDGTSTTVGSVGVTTHDTASAVSSTNGNDYVLLDAYTQSNSYNGKVSFDGGNGNDVIIGTSGGGTYTLSGGNGDDFIYSASTNSARSTLDGGNGNDRLEALGRNDLLKGGSGDDTIVGHANQTLEGDGGADKFVLTAGTPFNPVNISDYSHSDGDKIDISALLDTAFQGHNDSDASKFVHVASNGHLQIDPTGQSGANNHWQDVAVLTNVTAGNVINVVFDHAQQHQVTAA